MWRNYVLISLRNLQRNKLYTTVNLLGLAIGISCFVWLVLYVQDEWEYDRHHQQADRIYRVVEKIDLEGQGEESSSNPFPTGPALLHDHPELIEEMVRFFDFQVETHTLTIEEEKFEEADIYFADSSVFQVFDFPLMDGDPMRALHQPNSIVLTQELASKLFPGENPMGQQVKYEGDILLQVTGVFDELPRQSHLHFQALVSFLTLEPMMGRSLTENWVWNPNWTYLLLQEGVEPAELEAQFPAFIDKYYPNFIKTQITHYLQPLTSIHLDSHLDYEMEPNSSRGSLYILLLIGGVILLIACINFMNLATARSAHRAQEVGMRKVLGAHRQQLVRQFLGESLVLTGIAVMLSIFLVRIGLPLFNRIADKELSFDLISTPIFLLALLGLGLIVGTIAGLYPAYYLSAFRPVHVLKGNLKSNRSDRWLRQSLVVVQFVISLVLIISTVVIYRQFVFLQGSDPGFAREQVIVIPTKPTMIDKIQNFKDRLQTHPGILGITVMNEIIGVHHNVHEFNYEGMDPEKWVYFPGLMVDEDFVETFGLEVIAGRDFDLSFGTEDTASILINETMVKELNWGSPEAAIGKQFRTPFGNERVVGVLKDFHIVSLKEQIRPFVLDITVPQIRGFFTKHIAIRIQAEEIPRTLSFIGEQWDGIAPKHPFTYSFLDEELNHLYRDENRLSDLVGYFSVLAILIACLGLFALASFTAEQRSHEIGVRKVLGSSVAQVIELLARDYLKLVLIANLIAWPIAWFTLARWLEGFAYQISLSWGVFLLAALGVMALALLTVAFQSVRAALSDPADVLREE
ncbi:MAG: ABC transporter permease [Bacteroidota bacterium]